jgi:hypothetical protein
MRFKFNILLIFFILTVYTVSVSSADSLPECFLFDGDFETDPEGLWSVDTYGDYSSVDIINSEDAHAGDYFARFTVTAPPEDEGYATISQFIDFTLYSEEDDYTNFDALSFYVHIEGYTTAVPTMYVPTYFGAYVQDVYFDSEYIPIAFEDDGWYKVYLDISKIGDLHDGLTVTFTAWAYDGQQIEVWLDDVCFETRSRTCGITGGDFESGDMGYFFVANSYGSIEGTDFGISDIYSKSGEYSAKVGIKTPDDSGCVLLYQYIDCCDDIGTIDFSYRLSDGCPAGTVLNVWYEYEIDPYMGVNTINSDRSELLFSTSELVGDWVDETVNLTSSTGHCSSFGRLIFEFWVAYGGYGNVWLDDIVVHPVEHPSPEGGVVNGDFETGNNIGWCMYELGTYEAPSTIDIRNVEDAHSGDYVSRLHACDEDFYYVQMYQDISPPPSDTLSFYMNFLEYTPNEQLEEEENGDNYFSVLVCGLDGNGHIVGECVGTEYREETEGWVEETIDISSVTGLEGVDAVRILFTVLTDGVSGEALPGEVEVLIDDVFFESEICESCGTTPPQDTEFVASFERTPKLGDCPLTVTFTDVSVGGALNRSWNFGDGTIETTNSSDIVHTYYTPGKYTVELIISDGVRSNTASRYNSVYVTGAMVPNPTTTFGQIGEELQYAQYNVTEYAQNLPMAYMGIFDTDSANAWFYFWGLVFMFIFIAIFIRVEDTSLIMLFGLLVAGSIMALLPSEFRMIGQALLIIAIASVIYILIKGRFK